MALGNDFGCFLQRLEQTASFDPARRFLVGGDSGEVTFAQARDQISQWGQWWHSRRRAKRVLLYLPHGAQKAQLILSALSSQVVGLTMSLRSPPANAVHVAKQFAVGGIFTTRWAAEQISPLLGGVEAHTPPQLKTQSSHELCYLELPLRNCAAPGDLAWALLTSGSTGAAKAVMISWKNLRARTESEVELFHLRGGEAILNFLSFAHDLGLNQLLTALWAGSTLRILNSPLAGDLWTELQSGEVSGTTATPAIWESLLGLVTTSGLNPSRYSGYLTVSGGTLATRHLIELRRFFPQAQIIKTYGQTETFRSLAETRQERIAEDSAGCALSRGVRLRLVDSEGRECPVGEVGELVHFGDGASMGYLDDASFGQTKFIEDPELGPGVRSGDFFRVLESGGFQFVGRQDGMIKRHDHRVYLNEIENALKRWQAIHEAAVLSVGNQIVTWVCPRPGDALEASQVWRWIKNNLPSYQVPDTLYVRPNLPRTFSSKTDFAALRHEHSGVIV